MCLKKSEIGSGSWVWFVAGVKEKNKLGERNIREPVKNVLADFAR